MDEEEYPVRVGNRPFDMEIQSASSKGDGSLSL